MFARPPGKQVKVISSKPSEHQKLTGVLCRKHKVKELWLFYNEENIGVFSERNERKPMSTQEKNSYIWHIETQEKTMLC